MLGLQIYTVRNKMTDEDSAYLAMKEIKEIGYECVQLAGNIKSVELGANAAKKAGLAVVGILTDIKTCETESERLFEFAHSCGAEDIGISSGMKTKEEAMDIIARANKFAKTAKENGFSFSYHNHSNEFIRTPEGDTLMKLLISGFDAELIHFMPDTYWLQHGGIDIRDFIEKQGKRTKILHIKDMKRTIDGPTFAEIGLGNINFARVIDTAKKMGIKYFIVEQDVCDIDSMESARISYNNAKELL